jgi:hypothetical protein
LWLKQPSKQPQTTRKHTEVEANSDQQNPSKDTMLAEQERSTRSSETTAEAVEAALGTVIVAYQRLRLSVRLCLRALEARKFDPVQQKCRSSTRIAAALFGS